MVMRPRKSTSDWSNESGFPEAFYKICKEEDVLIIPQLVTQFVGRQVDLHRKSKDSKLEKLAGNSISQVNDSKTDDLLNGHCVRPPQMGVVYENPEDKETPVAVICKSFYIEFSLINAFGKSLKSYPNITCLKIENCCISNEIGERLALILAEEPGRRISHLSLDGNETIAEVLHLFVAFPTGVRSLSLQRCSLDDESIKPFCKALGYTDEKEHKLQILNLSMNKIGNDGMLHLAGALRTNRSLLSLSLAGNRIGDEGVAHLAEVLQRFQLTYEEVVMRRKRIFEMIFRKKNAVERHIEEWKTKGEVETQLSKTNLKNLERCGRKIRGPDGKIRCVSSREIRNKPSTAKVNPGEKFQGRSGKEDVAGGVEPTPAEIAAIVQKVENETPPDKHPFVNEVFAVEKALCCSGCWSLKSINLAFNYLTEESLEKFTQVFYSQSEDFGPKSGILRLVLMPGNLFHENFVEFQKLQSAIIYRHSKKGGPENPDLAPASTSPMTSARRMSLTGKRGKSFN